MREKGLYESPAEFQKRVDVLQILLELVPAWVQMVARQLGKPESEVAEANGSVLTYGSFRLSTHGPGMLCLNTLNRSSVSGVCRTGEITLY